MPGTIRHIVVLLLMIQLFCLTGASPVPGTTGDRGHTQGTIAGDHHIELLRDGEYFETLLKAVRGAKTEIVMAFFLFKTQGYKNSPPDILLRTLIEAAERGVGIRILLEKGKDATSPVDESNRKTALRLRAKGIEVSFDTPRRTTHTKVVVIDRRYTFLGSHNLTSSALQYNHELSLFVDSPGLAMETLKYINMLH